jgi:predicted CopG family antitoxin
MSMSTTIRVSEDTKKLLERLKREDETFDELLARIARESNTMNPGAWSSEKADAARERLKKSKESFERNR